MHKTLSKMYKAIWSRLGGRPFTFVIRDFYHQHPIIFTFITLGIGALLGHLFWQDYTEGEGK